MSYAPREVVVQSTAGSGEIRFPAGGRIRSRFTLTESATGQHRLLCTGTFPQASYRGWEQLVHQYRVGPGRSQVQAEQLGLVESFAGRTEDTRALSIPQMVLLRADARGLDQGTLRLYMEFDCRDVRLEPQPAGAEQAAAPAAHVVE